MNEFMSCRALIEFLDDYVEGRLLPSERARFDAHLAVCPACVRYLKGYHGTVVALSRLAVEDARLPASVPTELFEAILSARRAAAG